MWIVFSFGAMGLLATMLLLFVPLGRMGVHPSVVLFYLFTVGALLSFVYLKYFGTSLRLPGIAPVWIVFAAIASFLGNLCYLRAINLAPNPGYPTAIEGSKMLVVTLLSVWLFAAPFSCLKGLGALCCAVGVALMCL